MTTKLITEPQIDKPDDFYQSLIDLYRDTDEEQSRLVSSKLILLLSNHIGDMEVLNEAMSIAANLDTNYQNENAENNGEKA